MRFCSRQCTEKKEGKNQQDISILGDTVQNFSYLSDMSVGSDRSLWHLTCSEDDYLQGIQCGFPLMMDEQCAKVRQVSVSSAHARSSVSFSDLRTEVSQGSSVCLRLHFSDFWKMQDSCTPFMWSSYCHIEICNFENEFVTHRKTILK